MSMLGKRKRDTAILRRQTFVKKGDESKDEPKEEANEIFRKYFEATFEPLSQSHEEPAERIEEEVESDERQDSQSDWSGFAEDDVGTAVVRIVEHQTPELADSKSTNSRMFRKVMVRHRNLSF